MYTYASFLHNIISMIVNKYVTIFILIVIILYLNFFAIFISWHVCKVAI